MSDRRTPDATLIEAVRILSRTIQTDDGVIPACLAETATRLAELVEERRSISTLHQKVEGLEEENKRLREERRWVPVGERLPEIDVEVLCTCEIEGDFSDVSIGRSTGRMNDIGIAVVMDLDGDGDLVPCTHWMPKPLPPGPEGDA